MNNDFQLPRKYPPPPRTLIACLFLIALGPYTVHAQTTLRADSLSAHEEAEDAQRRFEQIRRNSLPYGNAGSGRCQLSIGRYCLRGFTWGNDDDWEEVDEPQAIAIARNELLETLDSIGMLYPGNFWVTQQHVRYLVDGDSTDGAVLRSRECEPMTTWECKALLGYAFFHLGNIPASEVAFSEALSQMPDSIRCEWTDLSPLLTGSLRNTYRDHTCSDRSEANKRLLWLSDPLWMMPGNALTAEHFARHVFVRMIENSESTNAQRFGEDKKTITLKYGWPVATERIPGGGPSSLVPEFVNRYGRGARYFLPNIDAYRNPTTAAEESWGLTPVNAPAAGHTPYYSPKGFHALPHRLSVFRRADNAILIAQFRFIHDSISDTTRLTAAIVAYADADSDQRMSQRNFLGPAGTLTLAIPLTPHIVSIEILTPGLELAARSRYGVRPNEHLATGLDNASLSDLLLTQADDSLPETLEVASLLALGQDTLSGGDRVGLFWEFYPNTEMSVEIVTTITVRRLNRNVFSRIGGLLGIASNRPPVRLTWEEVTNERDVFHPRAVAIDLPPNLNSGRYLIELNVTLPTGETLSRRRELIVR